MTNTIRKELLDKRAEELQRELEAPTIYELAIMSPKKATKRVREWLDKRFPQETTN